MKTSINIIGWILSSLVTIAKVIIGFWIIVGMFALGFLVPAFGIICLVILGIWLLSR